MNPSLGTKTHLLFSTWDRPWDLYGKDVHPRETAISSSCPFLTLKPKYSCCLWKMSQMKVTDAELDSHSYHPLPTPPPPPLPRIKPCGGSIFPSCGPSCSSCTNEPHFVDSLCGPRPVNRLAAIQVGLTGVGVDGYSQNRMLLLSGPVFFTRVC